MSSARSIRKCSSKWSGNLSHLERWRNLRLCPSSLLTLNGQENSIRRWSSSMWSRDRMWRRCWKNDCLNWALGREDIQKVLGNWTMGQRLPSDTQSDSMRTKNVSKKVTKPLGSLKHADGPRKTLEAVGTHGPPACDGGSLFEVMGPSGTIMKIV